MINTFIITDFHLNLDTPTPPKAYTQKLQSPCIFTWSTWSWLGQLGWFLQINLTTLVIIGLALSNQYNNSWY